MSFHEFTITDTLREIMVCVCLETGKALDVYTYLDQGQPEFYDENERLWKAKWKPGKNPLFGHLSPRSFDRFATFAIEYMMTTSDLEELEAAIDSGELPDVVLQNPIIQALRE